MEKKNTMLLTVIAVATLLVAVVGATFAYFTASASGTGTTTVTVETESISTITVDGSADMTFSLTAAQMADLGQTETYTSANAATVYVELDNPSATSKLTCDYEVTYTPTINDTYSKFVNSYNNSENVNEFYLTATVELNKETYSTDVTNNASTGYSLHNITTEISLVTGSIEIEKNTTSTQTLSFDVFANYVNFDYEQDGAGTDYFGTVTLTVDNCVYSS